MFIKLINFFGVLFLSLQVFFVCAEQREPFAMSTLIEVLHLDFGEYEAGSYGHRIYRSRRVGTSPQVGRGEAFWTFHNEYVLGFELQERFRQLHKHLSENPNSPILEPGVLGQFLSPGWKNNIYQNTLVVALANLPGPLSEELAQFVDLRLPSSSASSALVAAGFFDRAQTHIPEATKARLARYIFDSLTGPVIPNLKSKTSAEMDVLAELIIVAELNSYILFLPELKEKLIQSFLLYPEFSQEHGLYGSLETSRELNPKRFIQFNYDQLVDTEILKDWGLGYARLIALVLKDEKSRAITRRDLNLNEWVKDLITRESFSMDSSTSSSSSSASSVLDAKIQLIQTALSRPRPKVIHQEHIARAAYKCAPLFLVRF